MGYPKLCNISQEAHVHSPAASPRVQNSLYHNYGFTIRSRAVPTLRTRRVRYLRVQTTSPENIRYGRSPAAPAPPSPVPPPVAARRSAGAATALRRSRRSRRRTRQETKPATIGSNGALRRDHGQLCCAVPDRSSVAVDGSFVPDGSVCSEGCCPGSSSGNAASSPRSPGPGGRRQKDVLAGESQVVGKKEQPSENVAGAGPVNDSQDKGERPENVDTEGDDNGWRGAPYPYLSRCSPPLTWDELEPWEQRNPRVEWMLTSRGVRGGEGRWDGKHSGVVVPKRVPVVPDGEVSDHARMVGPRSCILSSRALLWYTICRNVSLNCWYSFALRRFWRGSAYSS